MYVLIFVWQGMKHYVVEDQ